MLDHVFSWIAPHYCLSCGEIGAEICDNCFYDIDLAVRQQCVFCKKLLQAQVCVSCRSMAGVQQFVLADREGLIAQLVNEYKFGPKRSTYRVLARLFAEGAPLFPVDAQCVPLPTSAAHRRLRGFDHTRDIVKLFARRRTYSYSPVLVRRHNHAQVGASRSERRKQALTAYGLRKGAQLDSKRLYVLCDDIVTTGYSLVGAIRVLREAGAKHIAILVLMRQPLNK